MTELWLVRHSLSVANVEGWVTGCGKVELTVEGERQAIAMGEWLSDEFKFIPDLFITSAMRRAIQTAKLLNLQLEAIEYPELNETDAGDASYWKRSDFDNKYADFWEPFDEKRPFPGGESHMDLYERVIKKTREVISSSTSGDRVLMVAHAGTISSIFHHAYSVPMRHFSKFLVRNGSLSILRYQDFDIPPDLLLYDQVPL